MRNDNNWDWPFTLFDPKYCYSGTTTVLLRLLSLMLLLILLIHSFRIFI